MVSESTMRSIKLLFSIILGAALGYGMYTYMNAELWHAVGYGLGFAVLFYLLATERKAPGAIVDIFRILLVFAIPAYLAYNWYERTHDLQQTVGLGLVALVACYILIMKGFKKGGGGEGE